MDDVILYRENPTMFKNNPILFTLCFLLIPSGIGIVALLVWWIKVTHTTLTIDDEKSVLREGVFSKSMSEVYHEDVRNTQISKSFLQRMFGVGNLRISSAGQGDMEISIPGIPKPAEAKRIISRHGRDKSQSIDSATNNTSSIADELEKLADLKDRGVLDEDEFQAQKEKILE